MIRPNSPNSDPIFDPLLAGDIAQRVLDYRPTADASARLESLRERANTGTLTDDEHAEYEQLIESLDLIAILQAKARAALDQRAS